MRKNLILIPAISMKLPLLSCFLLLIMAGSPITVFCQSLEVAKMQFMAKQVIPPSPEAAALGQYGNVPVSLFTGTPTIGVPMYELKGNSIALTLSMSYNASGFKPEDEATWCGSGWSLNAGGVITRAVRGNPDNSNNYFGVSNVLNPPPFQDQWAQNNYLTSIQNETIETQPDLYYYNFAGHTGKFLLKPDYTVFKKEKDLNVINFNNGFTIVDEQGITYVFDEEETTYMFPSDDFGNPSSTTYIFPSSWYLRSMTSAAGDETIEFEYHTNIAGSVQNGNRLQNKSESYTYGVKASNSSCATQVFNSGSYTMPPPEILIYRKFLKKIIFKRSGVITAYIDILSATGQRLDTEDTYARRLNQVKVYSTNNTADKMVKQYDFTYGYFENMANHFNKRRLRLESLREISVDGITPSPPAYTFTYNTNVPIPERFTANLDHWGFHNGALNTSLLPNYHFAGGLVDNMYFQPRDIGQNADREASFDHSAATMLNKITYPTGGYSTFEYELNQAKFDDGKLHAVGGIRVKKITDYSFNNQPAKAKTYTYVNDDGTPSGRSGTFPYYQTSGSYHHYLVPYQVIQGDCSRPQEYGDYTLYTINVSANSIFGLGSYQGSHLGYTQVIESQVDLVNNQPLGKTVYNFSFTGAFAADENIENGDLVRQRVYRNDDKLLQETSNIYTTTTGDVVNSVLVKSLEAQSNKTWFCKTANNMTYQWGDWEAPPAGCVASWQNPNVRYPETNSFSQQNKQLTQTITKVYDEITNKYLVTTRDLFYDNALHNYPTRIEETTTNGARLKTAIKYVVDYAAAPSATAGTIAYNINYMQQKNIMGLPVEKLQYRQDAGGGNTRYINGSITDYITGKPSRIYFLEAQPLLTSVTPSSIGSGVFNYDNHYRLAATMEYLNENLVEQYKTSDVSKSYVWDYNNLYPVAEVTGAGDNEIWYTSFETNSKGGFTFSGTTTADAGSATGKKNYDLTNNPISASVDPLKTYILSYWRKNASGSFTVSGSTAVKQGATNNNWTYFEHTVGGTATVSISGSGFIDELRLYPSWAQMATRTYDPLIGVTSECDVKNNITYFTYDGLSRLTNIKDGDGNIVKNFRYNYGLGAAPASSGPTIYYNAPIEATYTKQGCTLPQYGETRAYKVPYGKYAAMTQAEADNMAAADLAANGQFITNLVGGCGWKNEVFNQTVYKTNCSYEQGPPTPVNYHIPQGRYFSLKSQLDANAMATAEFNAGWIAFANTNSFCSCTGEGMKYINGNCELGMKLNAGSYMENGMWVCPYYYRWSDMTVSGYYYVYSSDPCPIDP